VPLGHFQHDKKNNCTCTNTDGWGNKLVTIFARHLDSFILTNNFLIIYQTRDFGSGQILPLEQLYLSPGFAKIAPYPPCTVTAFWLKYRNRDRMFRRVTFTPSTAGPLVKMRRSEIGLAQ
jgi:hypothetical protein